MKTAHLFAALACTSILVSQSTASAACPNCPRSSISGGGTTMTMMPKGKKIDAGVKTSIASVAGNAVTISKDQTTATYLTDSNTRIFINGNAASVERLAKGMRVVVETSSLKPKLARAITATSGS